MITHPKDQAGQVTEGPSVNGPGPSARDRNRRRSAGAGSLARRLAPAAAAAGLASLLLAGVTAPAALASAPYPPQFLAPAVVAQPTNDPPAIGFYGGQFFYVFWANASNGRVAYSAYGYGNCGRGPGGTPLLTPCWTPRAYVAGPWGQALSSPGSTPAVVDYGGDMYVVWAGKSTGRLFYSAFNGATWSAQATVSGTWGTAASCSAGCPTSSPECPSKLCASVSAAVYNGDLYLSWADTSGHDRYSEFNGTSWSAPSTLPSSAAPSDDCCSTPLVAYDGELYEFWGMLPVWYSAYNGSGWSAPAKLAGTWGNGAQVGYGKSMAVADGELYAVWEAGGSGAARYSYFDGSTWAAPATVPGTAGPKSSHFALGASRGSLYMAWLANRHINFTYADNVGSPPPPPPR